MTGTEKPDLTKDVENARLSLSPLSKRVRGLFQLWNIFTSAHQLATAFERDFNSLKHESKMAFSKGIIIDYAKPWSKNRSKDLQSLVDANNEIPFLTPIINSNSTHGELAELRNKLVAHIDEGYESLGVSVWGADIDNAPSSRPQDPGTLDSVFVPVSISIESDRGMWWIDSAKKVAEIKLHIEKCRTATQLETSKAATTLRDECFNYIHVLPQLSDILTVRKLAPGKGGTSAEKDYDFTSARRLDNTFSLKQTTNTLIGDANLQSLVGRYEPTPSLPEQLRIEGRGYILDIPKANTAGKVRWTVTFPKYPFPAEKP